MTGNLLDSVSQIEEIHKTINKMATTDFHRFITSMLVFAIGVFPGYQSCSRYLEK